ncbi:MAG: helix-turn-helix transcriptional regulator [Alphaproteobacteria bacterium]|nr:helix-turn-helix transcriptional regulator [Alphaproteobacteria bacterium]
MARKAEEAAGFLRLLANRHRLMILCSLLERECSVGELAERLAVPQPTVSQHLFKLRAEGLVSTRRQGTTIHYSLAQDSVRAVIDVLYREFCAPR